jgi:hypothetical protein
MQMICDLSSHQQQEVAAVVFKGTLQKKTKKIHPMGVALQSGKGSQESSDTIFGAEANSKTGIEAVLGGIKKSISMIKDFTDHLQNQKPPVRDRGKFLPDMTNSEQKLLKSISCFVSDHAATQKSQNKCMRAAISSSIGDTASIVECYCCNHKSANLQLQFLEWEQKKIGDFVPSDSSRKGGNSGNSFLWQLFKQVGHLREAYVRGTGVLDMPAWMRKYHPTIEPMTLKRQDTSRHAVCFENAIMVYYMWDVLYLYLQATITPEKRSGFGLEATLLNFLENKHMKAAMRWRGIIFVKVVLELRIAFNHNKLKNKVLDVKREVQDLDAERQRGVEGKSTIHRDMHSSIFRDPRLKKHVAKYVDGAYAAIHSLFVEDETDDLLDELVQGGWKSLCGTEATKKRYNNFWGDYLDGGRFDNPSPQVKVALADVLPHTDEAEGTFGTFKFTSSSRINTSLLTILAITNWSINQTTDDLRRMPRSLRLELVKLSYSTVKKDFAQFKTEVQQMADLKRKLKDKAKEELRNKEFKQSVQAIKFLIQHEEKIFKPMPGCREIFSKQFKDTVELQADSEDGDEAEKKKANEKKMRVYIHLHIDFLGHTAGVRIAKTRNKNDRPLEELANEIASHLEAYLKDPKPLLLKPPDSLFKPDWATKQSKQIHSQLVAAHQARLEKAGKQAKEEAKEEEKELRLEAEAEALKQAAAVATALAKEEEKKAKGDKKKQEALAKKEKLLRKKALEAEKKSNEVKKKKEAKKKEEEGRLEWLGCTSETCLKWRIVSHRVYKELKSSRDFQCDWTDGGACQQPCDACQQVGKWCGSCIFKKSRKRHATEEGEDPNKTTPSLKQGKLN